jgi:hypothetical protein
MASLQNGRSARKRAILAPLPLFDYADAQRVSDLPLSARRLVRRWRMSPATARIVAELAGFPTERD